MKTVKRVLAIGAHPGDIGVLCSGTLARFARQGASVVWAAVTDGAAGHAKMPIARAKLAAMRLVHETQAAGEIGAEMVWMGREDGLLFEVRDLTRLLVDLVRQARPDVVITHRPDDYHTDNSLVGREAYQAVRLACLHNLRTAHRPLASIPMLYHMDSWISRSFEPTEYVDITTAFAAKQAMVRANKIGVKWLRDFDGVDIFDLIATAAKFRGLQCGAKYAECFQSPASWPQVPTSRLLP